MYRSITLEIDGTGPNKEPTWDDVRKHIRLLSALKSKHKRRLSAAEVETINSCIQLWYGIYGALFDRIPPIV